MAETARVRHPVVIAGGGPTGMMLAAELAIAGSAAVVVEPRPNQALDGSRAGGLHSRTIEVLDQRGVAERFLQAGQVMQVQGFAMIPLDISDFPTRHNYGLALWQSQFEQILAGWTAELGVQVIRGRKVTGFTQSADAVVVELDHGELIECSYLVGCDGGHSTVRESAGIGFEGLDASTSWMIAEVEMDGDPVFGMHRDASGNHGLSRRAQGEPIRVVITEPELRTGRPSLEELRSALHEVFGTDYGLSRAHWISRFTDASRQASEYRAGRVLLAGDAAHVHPPQGGQGLNTGVQDAVNLGWKLAGVLRGDSGEGLLDTYHAERHPVGARVQRNTMAQVVLGRSGERHRALHATMTDLLALDEARKAVAGMISGLDIHYDLGSGHPLLGRRMPDLDLSGVTGASRVFELLHDGRGVLLNPDRPARADAEGWSERVRVVDATCGGPWELPVIGEVEVPGSVLIRPDGHVAWVGESGSAGLREALGRWFGPSRIP